MVQICFNRCSLFIISFTFLVLSCKSQEVAVGKVIAPDTTRVNLVFIGDVMGHMPVINSGWVDSTSSYDFTPIYEYVSGYISKADLAIANLEVPLAGKPYSGYPQFSSPDEFGFAMKHSGIDVALMANNHALDRGKKGLLNTLKALDSLQLYYTGVFRDSSERNSNYPLFLTINNIKIALLNYTYGTNGIKPEKPIVINYSDTSIIKKDIENCYLHKADFIVANMHWGIEYDRFASKEQHTLANYILNKGAHAIVGSHPHVIQPYYTAYPFVNDSVRNFPVLLSLGNFISNQRDRYRDGGLIFELNITKIGSDIIWEAGYIPVWVYKGIYNNRMMYKLIPFNRIDEAIEKYGINKTDSTKCMEFFNDTRQHLRNLKEISILD